MDIIEQKISENYPSKAAFSKEVGISPKDLSSKLNTVQKKIGWLNEFIKPLNLKVEIVETDVSSNGG